MKRLALLLAVATTFAAATGCGCCRRRAQTVVAPQPVAAPCDACNTCAPACNTCDPCATGATYAPAPTYGAPVQYGAPAM